MNANKIFREIQKHAPIKLALDFDTVGLSVGNRDAEIDGVLVCENVTHAVIDEAKENGCNLIISHHPAIFGDTIDEFTQSIIEHAHNEQITLYSAHTNLDAADGGLNDYLAEILGIEVEGGKGTCARWGHFKEANTLENKTKEIAKILKDKHIRTVGDKNKNLVTACVSCGSGARDDSLVEELNKLGIDVLIGGENKLSLALKMQYYDICLIEVGHYNSEIICKDIFAKWLENLEIKVVKSERDINPYND